jgi:chromosomal replication initiation ATPase DnaA
MGVYEFTQEEIEHSAGRFVAGLRTRYAEAVEIRKRIARKHGVSVEELVGRSCLRHVVEARRELYCALRARKWSYPAIGRFCGRDHTTVMAAVRKEQK